MSETTRTRTHAPEIRQRAVEILQEGVGHRALAAELGIPQATARQWARAYAVGGADAVLTGLVSSKSIDVISALDASRDSIQSKIDEVVALYESN